MTPDLFSSTSVITKMLQNIILSTAIQISYTKSYHSHVFDDENHVMIQIQSNIQKIENQNDQGESPIVDYPDPTTAHPDLRTVESWHVPDHDKYSVKGIIDTVPLIGEVQKFLDDSAEYSKEKNLKDRAQVEKAFHQTNQDFLDEIDKNIARFDARYNDLGRDAIIRQQLERQIVGVRSELYDTNADLSNARRDFRRAYENFKRAQASGKEQQEEFGKITKLAAKIALEADAHNRHEKREVDREHDAAYEHRQSRRRKHRHKPYRRFVLGLFIATIFSFSTFISFFYTHLQASTQPTTSNQSNYKSQHQPNTLASHKRRQGFW